MGWMTMPHQSHVDRGTGDFNIGSLSGAHSWRLWVAGVAARQMVGWWEKPGPRVQLSVEVTLW